MPPVPVIRSSTAGDPSAIRVALQLAGATAALVAFVTLVGGALLWIRFDQAHLPADQVVALLPRELLVIVGVHALALPVAMGLVWALVLSWIGPIEGGSWRTTLFLVALLVQVAALVALAIELGAIHLLWLVPLALAIAAVLAALLTGPGNLQARWQAVRAGSTWRQTFFLVALALLVLAGSALAAERVRNLELLWWLVTGGAVLLAVVAVVLTALNASRRRGIAWVVFAACVLCGASFAVARTAGTPKLEPVALRLQSGETLAGFHVARSSDRVYVAPLPGGEAGGLDTGATEINRVVEIPRAEVVRSVTRAPAEIEADDEGRALARQLLADLQPQGTVSVVATGDPVTAFAPVVHLHREERYWPMSAEAFLASSWLMWAHAGGSCDYSVVGGRHVATPARQSESLLGAFAVERLGREPGYAHPSAGDGCGDRRRRAYSTTDHTRPYDTRDRPPGLGEREGFYLDLLHGKRHGRDPGGRFEGSQRLLPPVPVYWEWAPERTGRGPAVRITYWLFYGLSRPPGPPEADRFAHEGDWEGLSVLLLRGESEDRWLPLSARFNIHDEKREVAWAAVDRVLGPGAADRTHPVAYSALESHASYPRPDAYPQVFRIGGRPAFTVRDRASACPRCPEWRTWERLRDARAQPWYGFGGAWGAVGEGRFAAGTTGPLGPSRYKSAGQGSTAEDIEPPPPQPG